MPVNSFAGNTFDATTAFDSQVAVGHVRDSATQRAAVWQRSTIDDWSVNTDIAVKLVGEHEGESAITEIAGSSSLLIALLTIETPSGETRQHPIVSSDIDHWALIDLPGTDADNWEFGMHVDGANGLIAARLISEEDPVSKIFTTSDAGTSWQADDVTLPNGRSVRLRDAIFDDTRWFAVGSTSTEDGQEPVTFSYVDQAWEASTVSFDFGTIDPIEDGTFVAVARLDSDRLLAIVDTDPGSRTFISTDGSEWTHAIRHWLDLGSPAEQTSNFSAMSDGPVQERILVTRGFDAPVWLDGNGMTRTADAAFDGTHRQIDGVAASSGGFFMFTHRTGGDFSGTDIWHSPGGTTWEFLETHATVIPDYITGTTDTVFFNGRDRENARRFRMLGSTQFDLDISDLVPVSTSVSSSAFATASAMGRNLLAARIRTETEQFMQIAFVDLSDPGEVRIEVLPDSAELFVGAICPQLSSGETTLIFGEVEQLGMRVEVWADRAEPFIGAGQLGEETNGFANVAILGCFAMADDLLAIGAECPKGSFVNNNYLIEECQAQAWVSDTGLSWTEHPLNSVLTDANQVWLRYGASIGPGVVFAGARSGSTTDTLWLATMNDLFEVPTDGLFSLKQFGVEEIVASNGQLLVRSGSDLFVADVDDLLRQTLPTEADFQDWTQVAQEPVPTFDPSTAEPPPSTPVPPPQRNNPAPAAPAPTPAPAQAPTPTTTPIPSPAQTPPCNPGDLTTTGACVCSGGRLFDNGGQCVMRCLSSEDSDGFGGCIRRDGTQSEPQSTAIAEFTFEVPGDN